MTPYDCDNCDNCDWFDRDEICDECRKCKVSHRHPVADETFNEYYKENTQNE